MGVKNDCKQPLLVVCAIIQKDNKILIARRGNDGSVGEGKWEFPGGKVEYLEDPKDAVTREVDEELKLDIEVNSLFAINSHVYQRKDFLLHIILMSYLCDYVSGEIKLDSHEEAKWILIEEFDKYNFADADYPIIEELLDYYLEENVE